MSALSIIVLSAFVQAQSSSIEGTVKTRTGDPIAKATVTLTQNLTQGASTTFITGSDGRFLFPVVLSGSYKLTAKRNGYADTEYGRRGTNGGSSSLTVTAGNNLKDVTLTMIAYGAISGRITDADGEPAVSAPVQALRYTYSEGRRTLTEMKGVTTNDRGEYRLFWLLPGKYYIRSGGANTVTVNSFNPGVSAVHIMVPGDLNAPQYAPIYFPGTSDPQTATAIDLIPGADYGDVDFTLSPPGSRRVRVSMMDTNVGQPGATATLSPRSPAGPTDVKRAAVGGQGQFNGVSPGSYILTVTSAVNPRDGNAGRRMGASIPVDVRNQDVDVAVTLTPGVDFGGRVSVEGLRNSGDQADTHPIVSLIPLGNRYIALGINDFADFHGDEAFDFTDVIAGDYTLMIEDIPKGQYLKAARLGSNDVLTDGFHIDSRTTGTLDIVLGADGGTVTGTVVDVRRQPAANISVTLIPGENHHNRDDLYKRVTTDPSGRFSIQAVAPGTYTVFAWEDVDPANIYDLDFIHRFASQGRPISINASGTENVELIAIPDGY